MGLNKGQTNSGSFKKGHLSWMKGRHIDLRKTDKKLIGKNISLAKKGTKLTEEHKKSLRLALKGKQKLRGKHWKIKDTSNMKGRIPWNYLDGRSKLVGPGRYGDDWFKIRMLIYKRDNFTCQECALKMSKETGAFHIHHKIPFLTSFDNSLNNLITLCPSCHRKIDAELIRQIKLCGGKNE